MISVHFAYRHIDKPWGGANTFIRALHADLTESGQFSVASSIDDDYDVLFMNQLGTGPGGGSRLMPLQRVRELTGRTRWSSRRKPTGRKLIVRAVNLNQHAFSMGPRNLTIGWWRDRNTIALLNMADISIFQSAYQREFFVEAGYRADNGVVIHNGAGQSFWVHTPPHPPLDGPLRLLSSTASPRASKRHDLIAQLSLLDGVDVSHLGAWPEGLDTGRVRLLGIRPREDIIAAMAQCHFFLHPAVKDPCPNSVFEAVCAGLPVIYNPGPGSSTEIVGTCGLALDEQNLAATVALARQQLDALRSEVLSSRWRFSIGHAAARYREVFEHLAVTTAPAA